MKNFPLSLDQSLAVLTGDIVRSSTLTTDRRRDLFGLLNTISMQLQKDYPVAISYNMAKYRGDGWQLVINTPGKALEIALMIRTCIRFQFAAEKVDTRVAIAVGKADFIPPDNISEGFGPVFTASGGLLDSLKTSYMDIAFAEQNDSPACRLLAALIKSYDTFITAWTPGQCQAVFYTLRGMTQVEIAEYWRPKPITQSTVSQHLKAAHWDLISSGLWLFEESVRSILLKGDNHESNPA